MKLRILMVALVSIFGPGCVSTDKSHAALRVDPVMTIRHGAPDTQSYYQLARYYHGQQRLNLAEEAYLKAIAAGAGNVNAFNALASLYAERQQLDKAVQTFEKALAIAPDAGYIHNNLGYAYYLQGRQEQAYAAVRKALSIDPGLARGWSNLQQIVAMGSDSSLANAVAARRLDTLPSTMQRASEYAPPVAKPSPVIDTADLVVVRAEPIRPGPVPENGAAEPGRNKLPPAAATASSLKVSAGPEVSAYIQVREPQTSRGKFVLVSSDGEVVLQSGKMGLDSAISAAPDVSSKPLPKGIFEQNATASLSEMRLEVSNGNGITGFAKRYVAILQSKRVPVQRITNYDSFALTQTLVEFQPGYESVARALMSRARLDASLVPAKSAHSGWNVRILLGKNAVEMVDIHSRGAV